MVEFYNQFEQIKVLIFSLKYKNGTKIKMNRAHNVQFYQYSVNKLQQKKKSC